MSQLIVNRADLAWALNATLPHVGSPHRNLDFVGFDCRTVNLRLFATDSYTVGVANIEQLLEPYRMEQFYLSLSEAKELLRFIRPTLKAHHDQKVALVVQDDTLDVLLKPLDGGSETLSQVYSLRVPGHSFQDVYGLVQKVSRHRCEVPEFVAQPVELAKFSKAQRHDTDQVSLYSAADNVSLSAVVTVGTDFVGAVMGIAIRDIAKSTLSLWGLEKAQLLTEQAS